MKVFEITMTAKPPKGNFSEYAPIAVKNKKDEDFLDDVNTLHGEPFPRKWRPIELYIFKPRLPRPDFYDFAGNAFVCSERVLEIVAEPLEMSGELLPVTIEGEPGNYYIYNCTNCINVLDPAKTVYRQVGKGKEAFQMLSKPAFHAERFGEECLFKFPEDGAHRIYCLERSGEADEGEFKALVDRHKLTGLKFELVWTDKRTKHK